MGVSGAGKTTLGVSLARRLGWAFVEGDDHHPAENVAKMRSGKPLNDADRRPWLEQLCVVLAERAAAGHDVVLACSALKASYRDILDAGIDGVRYVLLEGDRTLIDQRLAQRRDHFMPPELLDSQFDILERPEDALHVAALLPTARQVEKVIEGLGLPSPAPSTDLATKVLVDGLAFPEAPRWRDGWLWFTDQHARTVSRAHPDGRHEVVATTDDLPGGLGWLPDGSLLVVYMTERRIMKLGESGLTPRADLSAHASFHCNDMVVDDQGRAYAGNFGFDLHGGADVTDAELLLVDTDGHVECLADDLVFPNGMALTPDGRSMLVAETFAHRITELSLDAGGRIEGRRLWAELELATPDGICLDAEGAIWVASPGTTELVRVRRGGEVLGRCATVGTPYACMLGDHDRRTLFVCTAETDDPREAREARSGRIEHVRVAVHGVGWP